MRIGGKIFVAALVRVRTYIVFIEIESHVALHGPLIVVHKEAQAHRGSELARGALHARPRLIKVVANEHAVGAHKRPPQRNVVNNRFVLVCRVNVNDVGKKFGHNLKMQAKMLINSI